MRYQTKTLLALCFLTSYSLLASAQETAQAGKFHSKQTSIEKGDSEEREKRPFIYPGKGYFFQGEILVGFCELGAHLTGGYRFGQFGILGLGFGGDGVFTNIQVTNRQSVDPYNGGYFPLYVYYGGDILKKRITPFYAVQAGYAFRYVEQSGNDSYIIVSGLNHPVYSYTGGFTGGLEFGLKLYAGRKLYMTWSLEANFMQAADRYSNSSYNSIGQDIKVSYSSSSLFVMPGVKFAIGF